MLGADLARGLSGLEPAAVVRPPDVAALAAAVAEAGAAGQAVVAWGGGTHQARGNALVRYDLAIDMGGLTAVRDHAPADLTLTVEAGLTLAAVNRVLAPHGQCLPLDAEDPAKATIGGLLAAGVSGPRRLGAGTARDRLLWTEAVAADGQIVRGGAKVVKSVAGFDLPKLHLGALGSLGLVAAACFKLQPLPAATATAVLSVDDVAPLGALLAALSASPWTPTVASVAHAATAGWQLALGADGGPAAVAVSLDRFAVLARAHGAAIAVHEGAASEAVRDAWMAARGAGALRVKLVVLPDRVGDMLAALLGLAPSRVDGEALNGVIRVAWAEADQAAEAGPWREAAAVAEALGGHWEVEACPDAWKAGGLDVYGPPRPDRPLMVALKRALDPHGTLAPGRAIGG